MEKYEIYSNANRKWILWIHKRTVGRPIQNPGLIVFNDSDLYFKKE